MDFLFMTPRAICALYVISISCLTSVSAQTVLEVSSTDFYESYADNVKVSGSVLAASYVPGSFSHASPEQLYLYIPSHKPLVHIVLTSIDGKYSADAAIKLNKNQTGWIQIKLPTAYKKEYLKYLPDQLAVFVFVDSEDMFGDYIQEVFPSSWGAPTSNAIHFSMNSGGGNPNITFKNQSGKVITLDCRMIKAKYTRAFNHICDLGNYTIDPGTIITFSPEYNSSGKDYIIWTSNE